VYVPEVREDTLKVRGSTVSTVYHSLNNPAHPILSEQDKGDIHSQASQDYIKQRLELIRHNQENNIVEQRLSDDEEEEEVKKSGLPEESKPLVKTTHTASYQTPPSHISNESSSPAEEQDDIAEEQESSPEINHHSDLFLEKK